MKEKFGWYPWFPDQADLSLTTVLPIVQNVKHDLALVR